MPYEIQSKLKEQKAIEGMPSNWRVEFVKQSDDKLHFHFINVDFIGGEHCDRERAQWIVDKILKALNEEGEPDA